MWTILTSQWCHFSFISYTRSLRETGDTRIFITNYSVPLRWLTAIPRGRGATQWNLYLAVCHFPLHFSVHVVFHFHFLSAHIIIMCDIREENLSSSSYHHVGFTPTPTGCRSCCWVPILTAGSDQPWLLDALGGRWSARAHMFHSNPKETKKKRNFDSNWILPISRRSGRTCFDWIYLETSHRNDHEGISARLGPPTRPKKRRWRAHTHRVEDDLNLCVSGCRLAEFYLSDQCF